MTMAIVFDQLCGIGGTERVAQYVCEEFPEADVYTLAYNPDITFPFFRSRAIHTTWLNRVVRTTATFRWSFPIATYVMQSLDLRRYDVVLSCSATVAKYVTVANGKHICYCYIPTRALWHFDEYFGGSVPGRCMKLALNRLRRRDYMAAQRIDKFIAISDVAKYYVLKFYNRDADVIHCPVDVARFRPCGEKQAHYLLVSRLDLWKKVGYAIEAFNRLGLPLRIIGSGPDERRLRALAKANITFVGTVGDGCLSQEYSAARAVIFTPDLEYGLIPLEANACGTPVICYGKGGVRETMIPVNETTKPPEPATAFFFYEQTADALIRAVREFETCSFDKEALIEHASGWSVATFKEKMRARVLSVMNAAA